MINDHLSGPSLSPLSGIIKKIIIFLHGYGSNGNDLIELAHYFMPHLPDCLFLSPNAPYPFIIGQGGYQWFELPNLEIETLQKGISQASPLLKSYIDKMLNTHKLKAQDLALIGFSQGAMMALRTAPLFKEPLAGVLAYSGAFIPDPQFEGVIHSKPPLALIHGEEDTVVPPQALTQSREALKNLGFIVKDLMIPGLGHTLDSQGIGFGLSFLKEFLYRSRT